MSLLSGLLCTAWPRGAHAQDAPVIATPPSNVPLDQEREAMIERGLKLRQEAKDEEALASFQRAASIERDARILTQIAFAEQAMGRWADSYMHLTEALHDSGSTWIQEHRELLAQELKKIEGNIGRLDVRTNVAVAKLTIDGREVGNAPLAEPIVVTAGAVVISAHSSGYLSTTRRVPVHAGALSRVELILVPEPVLQRTETIRVQREEERVVRRPVWLYVAGAGAAISLSALGPWLRGNKLTEDLEKDCGTFGSCPVRFPRDEDKIRNLDTATTTLLAGGLSVTALAVATYFLWPRTEHRSVQPTASITPGAVMLGARIVH
jgi:hypothetical protein